MPGYWYGAARLLDFGNPFDAYNRAANGEQADGLGIMLDWEMVRSDLWQAFSNYELETKLSREKVPAAVEFASRWTPVKKKRQQFLSSRQPSSQPNVSESLAQFAITAQHFSGPLRPPEMLRRYEELLPGSADRVISMAERQSAHRQNLEKTVVDSNCTNERLGMILGFIMCVLAISAGTYSVIKGNDAFAIAAIVSALASPVAVFIYGKSEQKKDLQARQQSTVEAAKHTQNQ
jgi:uncharacterized membrane protein